MCDPPHPAFDILRTAILNAYRRTGKHFNIGRRIARMLRDAGLEAPGTITCQPMIWQAWGRAG
jgi:hypothetical protein